MQPVEDRRDVVALYMITQLLPFFFSFSCCELRRPSLLVAAAFGLGVGVISPGALSKEALFVSGDFAPLETQPPGMARDVVDAADSYRERVGEETEPASGSAAAAAASACSGALTGARRDKLGLCIALGSRVLMKF